MEREDRERQRERERQTERERERERGREKGVRAHHLLCKSRLERCPIPLD